MKPENILENLEKDFNVRVIIHEDDEIVLMTIEDHQKVLNNQRGDFFYTGIIQTGRHKGKPLWKHLSKEGKTVFIILED